jgi:hypothetical protein
MENRYSNIPTMLKTGKGRVYDSVLLPNIDATDRDIVVITVQGDRLDLLANEYYQDPSMWWVIALKNDMTEVDISMKEGIVLRIPSRTEAIQIKNSLK